MERDRVFSHRQDPVRPFSFNREVAGVFDDMLERSVPLYRETLHRQSLMAASFYQPDTRIYDLGCSHGNFGAALSRCLAGRPFRLVGVDSSWPMLERYRSRLGTDMPGRGIHLVCASLEDVRIAAASVVVISLTLQFLNPSRRDVLIRDIFHGLAPGGILLLTEKTIHPDPRMNTLEQEMYHGFKRENGYSDLEISQKRDALEKVLVPDTLDTQTARLVRAGFTSVTVWLRWFNFCSLIAVKPRFRDTHRT